MIYLVMCPPTGSEVHIKWPQHKSINDANKEMDYIRDLMVKQGKRPYDCYVYEADKAYVDKVYNLDDVDFNFYEEKTLEQKEKDFNEMLAKVKVMAADEEKKYGPKV